ncbi:MAG TPA: efflux RND transporter periplasmic adaptor subunit [Candidatus Eremiobacteraceae bacterium]|nr:efflux RND transporter periplasmic adaptor subunit [Candidatus Eremiobacteraceae bacterium]
MGFLRRWWALVALVLIVVVFIYASHRRASETSPPAPAIALATASHGTLLVRIIAHGRVGPPPGSSAALAFTVTGRVQRIDVHVGDHVEANQSLVQLESEPFILAVDQARGDYEAASGTLQSTTSSVAVRIAEAAALARQADLKVEADVRALQRAKTLYTAGITAARDVQAAQNQLGLDEADARAAHVRERALRSGLGADGDGGGQARADVLVAHGAAQRAQAALSQAERNLANATLRAPAPGVIVAILKHPGESVDPTTPVVTLGAELVHTATLSVPAEQARRIRVGDSAQLRVARSSEIFAGKVVATVSAVDPATQQATVVVSGFPASASPGDAVEADIVVASIAGVLVPTSAIVQDPQTGDTLVFVATTDTSGQQRFEPRKVAVGAGDRTTTQIKSGLRSGEKVAAEGAFELLAPATGSG